MRVLTLLLLLLIVPSVTAAQSAVVLQASAGPTLVDAGYSIAGGVGFSPIPAVTVSGNIDHIYIASQLRDDGRGEEAGFRGGRLTLATAELRVGPPRPNRVGPYGVAGFAAGVSRPNVNNQFPEAVTNGARGVFFGAGLSVPVGDRASFTVDARMILGAEGPEGIVALAPVRAGLAWRF